MALDVYQKVGGQFVPISKTTTDDRLTAAEEAIVDLTASTVKKSEVAVGSEAEAGTAGKVVTAPQLKGLADAVTAAVQKVLNAK